MNDCVPDDPVPMEISNGAPPLLMHDKLAGSSECTMRYKLHISFVCPHPAFVTAVLDMVLK